MTQHKSHFGSHIDPEIDENYRKTKSDIDSKVEKIVKLINGYETDKIIIGNMKKEAIIEMIKDFQEKYNSLYARYDNLTGKIREQAQSNGNENESSSSLSSSDLDPSKANGDFQESADQVGELSNTFEENQAFKNTVHRIFNILTAKMGNLYAENKDLKLQLDNIRIVEDELNEKLEDLNGEKENTLLEVDNKLKEKVDRCRDNEMAHNLDMESSALLAQKINWDNQIETQKQESAKKLIQKIQKLILDCQTETQKQESANFLTQEIQKMILESRIETQNKECAEFLTQEIQKMILDNLIETRNKEAAEFLTQEIQKMILASQIESQNKKTADFLIQKIKLDNQTVTQKQIAFDKLTEENTKVRRMLNECKEKLQYYIRIITEVIGKVDFTLVVLKNVTTRIFEEDLNNYENSISRIEKKVEDQDLVFKEMIGNLERKALEEKAKGEKLEEILKEKDQLVMRLGEEKREVIRQLCLSIEFYRTRCDELKEVIAKMVANRTRR